ncbi:TetR family transcriptional regulator [Murinocardiopsis flavida]|uniref:TetR family transcriptional regulator n=1 Tax=Murinocardiopsis flavida TaxID=645275 RepID=A0A2P8CYX8_9ACTN|nr:TetR/AcrR family transcriptional regulator C-terminal domain-containing protein [Murinocardiopsis flavida]PSK90185.1 TetR family transcriptional regulator [Murinocardiopsis flavida]
MVVYAGQGDAARAMALLWRTAGAEERTGPGPKPGLSVDGILDAAIAVADADGMAALSMRTVGERLGRTAMALYTYVPGKSELIDLMYDHCMAELPTHYDLAEGWRPALTSWAGDVCAFYVRHPWMLQVSQVRPVLGPNEYTELETLTRIVVSTGLHPVKLRRIVGTLPHFVRGAAQSIAESRHAAEATGVSEEDWWYSRSALLTETAHDFAERFPLLCRLQAEGAEEHPDDGMLYQEREARENFAVGLGVLCDGIEALRSGAAT